MFVVAAGRHLETRVEQTGTDILYGLVIETFEGEERAEFYPNGIGFYEPWDGLYDT
ncbi:hypothetical protein ACIBO2_20760 [Nonomuraea sp. NPDC050022]|uniref:hypothetical protein n=1 Tax=unclassified Nonomuraea TaxID=2593643 RepID=UPI0033C22E7D